MKYFLQIFTKTKLHLLLENLSKTKIHWSSLKTQTCLRRRVSATGARKGGGATAVWGWKHTGLFCFYFFSSIFKCWLWVTFWYRCAQMGPSQRGRVLARTRAIPCAGPKLSPELYLAIVCSQPHSLQIEYCNSNNSRLNIASPDELLQGFHTGKAARLWGRIGSEPEHFWCCKYLSQISWWQIFKYGLQMFMTLS